MARDLPRKMPVEYAVVLEAAQKTIQFRINQTCKVTWRETCRIFQEWKNATSF